MSFVRVNTLHRIPTALVQEKLNVYLPGNIIRGFKVVCSNLVPHFGPVSKIYML